MIEQKDYEISDLHNEWEKDSYIDDSRLDIESLKIPQLHNKYFKIYNKEKMLLSMNESDFRRLYYLKWNYYKGKLSKEELDEHGWEPYPYKVLDKELNIILEADDDLLKKKIKIDNRKQKIEFLDSVIKSISQRTFVIKNAIDYQKFTNGVI